VSHAYISQRSSNFVTPIGGSLVSPSLSNAIIPISAILAFYMLFGNKNLFFGGVDLWGHYKFIGTHKQYDKINTKDL